MEIGTAQASEDDRQYDLLLERMQTRFTANLAANEWHTFTTDAEGLWEAYLAALPTGNRAYHTCNACKRFITRFGSLVVINAEGVPYSAVWALEDAPPYYQPAIAAMLRLIAKARVTGVFYSPLTAWGEAITGKWTHFAVNPPPLTRYHARAFTAFQAMAEKRQAYGTLARAFADFKRTHLEQAVTLLRSDTLYRSEKVLGAAEWLLDLYDRRAAAKGKRGREGIMWRAVASAPAGFCHPRASMIGTLLDDLAGGLPLTEVQKRFASKMHPLEYQRPQTPPSLGNIKQAEDLIAKLGIAPALRRRFARVEELEAVWRPPAASEFAAPEGEVFAHLKPGAKETASVLTLKPITLTWVKFRDHVLPEATAIEYKVEHRTANYCGYVTAADPEAPPIFQWDTWERRNPFSLYLYVYGSEPKRWNLLPGWVRVNAISLRPSMWYGGEIEYARFGRGVLFALEGAKDPLCEGLGLFPEALKADLHKVRHTIEAYSAKGRLEGAQEASANGILLSQHAEAWCHKFRVTTKTAVRVYELDRWD